MNPKLPCKISFVVKTFLGTLFLLSSCKETVEKQTYIAPFPASSPISAPVLPTSEPTETQEIPKSIPQIPFETFSPYTLAEQLKGTWKIGTVTLRFTGFFPAKVFLQENGKAPKEGIFLINNPAHLVLQFFDPPFQLHYSLAASSQTIFFGQGAVGYHKDESIYINLSKGVLFGQKEACWFYPKEMGDFLGNPVLATCNWQTMQKNTTVKAEEPSSNPSLQFKKVFQFSFSYLDTIVSGKLFLQENGLLLSEEIMQNRAVRSSEVPQSLHVVETP